MMRKLITAVVLATLVLCMAGCGTHTPTLSLNVKDEKTAEIVLNKADPDDMAMAGTLEIAEGESLVVVPDIKDGSEAKIELTAVSEEQSESEVPEMGEADYELTVNGNDQLTQAVDPGSYMVKVTALSKSEGTISLKVETAQ